jgi:hypothetical protein
MEPFCPIHAVPVWPPAASTAAMIISVGATAAEIAGHPFTNLFVTLHILR